MSPKKYYTFMIEPDLAAALKDAKKRDPELSEGAIIRQALRDWFKKAEAGKKKRK